MAKNDFQHGGWNYYTLQCETIMTLISPGDCTLQCGMWLWNRDSEFTKWQHPTMWYIALGWYARWHQLAMWHVALESWRWIRQVAAPCHVAGGSGMACHWIRRNVRHIGILHLVSITTTSTPSTCHSGPVVQSPKFYQNRNTVGRKKWRHVDFQDGGSQLSWILGIQ